MNKTTLNIVSIAIDISVFIWIFLGLYLSKDTVATAIYDACLLAYLINIQHR